MHHHDTNIGCKMKSFHPTKDGMMLALIEPHIEDKRIFLTQKG
jgi:hypothetical protein